MNGASNPPADPHARPLDLNETFRGGGRSVEFLDEINKASIVVLYETGIVPRALASRIASGIAQVVANEPRSQRSADYLDYEPRLIAVAGPEASRLHSGRSRQDIASTIARMNLRDGLLQACAALVRVRHSLVALAREHRETIVPAYTHGVQAQPTTLGHYLAAFCSALARASERLRQAYARVNRNPLGAAALATSSFPLDRKRLGELLGFDGLVENAYDANHLAPADAFLDVAGAALPGVPGYLTGHNHRVAWASTAARAALVDLFSEKLRAEGEPAYHDGSRYQRLDEREERIEIRGRAPLTLRVRATHHGPLVDGLLPAARDPLALAWIGAGGQAGTSRRP